MSRPRVLMLAEPEKPPKKRCIRGHLLKKVGWTLHRFERNGEWYTSRRCCACLLDDVQSCQRKNKRAA